MPKFICGGSKYEIGGTKEDAIGLPVFFTGLPKTIKVGEYTLLLKDSFHVSLVCIGKIIEKHGVSIPDFINKLIADFCEYTLTESIDLIRYRDEFRSVEKDEKRSVVVMCDMTNLDNFFKLMNKKYGFEVEYPPTHVTLYTLPQNAGIFLIDGIDIAKLTKVIPNPIGKLL